MLLRNMWVGVAGLVVLVFVGGTAIVFAARGDHGSGNPTPTADTTSPEAVASRFFHWYASERGLGRDPIASGAIDANDDVTPGLRLALRSAAAGGQPGLDPLLCVMPIPHAFEVGKADVSGTSASVTLGAESHPMAWRAQLTRAGSVWRVNAVTCVVG